MAFEPGLVLDDYRLVRLAGQGSYGSVWLAENTLTGMPVALKLIPACGKTGEREFHGLVAAQSLRNRGLIPILHVGQYEDWIYYTMPPADNLADDGTTYLADTLANRLRRSGRREPDEILRMLDAVLEALEALHRHGLIHRDVKPDNIFHLDGHWVLGDIGLAASIRELTGSLAGTPGFLPDAVMRGERTALPRDDFYALGMVVYCALTGNPAAKYPEWPAELTLSGQGVLARAMTQPCGTVGVSTAAEFRQLLETSTSPVPPETSQQRTNPKIRMWRKVLLPVLLVLTLILLVLLIDYMIGLRQYYALREEVRRQQVEELQEDLREKAKRTSPQEPTPQPRPLPKNLDPEFYKILRGES